MKIGFIFAGQGTQNVGMGKEFYQEYEAARNVFDQVQVDFTIKNLCFEGPKEMLDDTAYAQCCILTTSLAIAEVIKENGITPDYVAGLSLGEYSALSYAGVMSVNDAARIVRERGKLMANALPKGTTAMAAVLAGEESVIREVCEEVSSIGLCQIANFNCPGQIVITGHTDAVAKASELLLERGARRVITLQVSGAFHSSLLEDASKQLYDVLSNYDLKQPQIPVVYNVSGKEEVTPIIDLLTKQIKSTVYFMQSIEYMIDQGVDTFIEIGPGNALSGFVRKTNRNIPVYTVDSKESLAKMLGALV